MAAPVKDAQHELFARAQRGDARAIDALVRAHMGLVYSIARKFNRTRDDTDLADLASEGSIGLLTAIDRFDTDRGAVFSTYAYRWIEHHVRNALLTLQNVKRGDAARRSLKREMDALVEAGASIPDAAAAVAERRGVMLETALGVHARLSARAVSLDKPVDGDESSPLGDLLGEDPEVDDQIDRARLLQALRARIGEFRQALGPRELAILDRRILGDEGLRELGEEFGCSKERIRQIEIKVRARLDGALQSLRTHARDRCAGRRVDERESKRAGPLPTAATSEASGRDLGALPTCPSSRFGEGDRAVRTATYP